MSWVADNWGTLVILAALIVIVFFIIRKMIRDRKNGRGVCNCGCTDCALRGECSKNTGRHS